MLAMRRSSASNIPSTIYPQHVVSRNPGAWPKPHLLIVGDCVDVPAIDDGQRGDDLRHSLNGNNGGSRGSLTSDSHTSSQFRTSAASPGSVGIKPDSGFVVATLNHPWIS